MARVIPPNPKLILSDGDTLIMRDTVSRYRSHETADIFLDEDFKPVRITSTEGAIAFEAEINRIRDNPVEVSHA